MPWEIAQRPNTMRWGNPWGEVTTLVYDALSREVRRTLGNSWLTTHTYDAAGRELVRHVQSVSGALQALYTATYDRAGNRTGVVELDGTRLTWNYDRTY